MNRTLKTTFAFALPVSVGLPLSNVLFGGAWNWGSAVGALLFGTILGALYAILIKRTMKNVGKSVVIDLPAGENRIKEDGSTYIKGKAGFPGRLVLTERCLVFKSKKIAEKDFEESIDLSAIQSVKERNFWVGPGNDLMITTNDQRLHRFVVYAPEEWIREIEQIGS